MDQSEGTGGDTKNRQGLKSRHGPSQHHMQETASWRTPAVHRMKTWPVRDLETGVSQHSAECTMAWRQALISPGSNSSLARPPDKNDSHRVSLWAGNALTRGASVCMPLVENCSHVSSQCSSVSLILVNVLLPLEDGAFMLLHAKEDSQWKEMPPSRGSDDKLVTCRRRHLKEGTTLFNCPSRSLTILVCPPSYCLCENRTLWATRDSNPWLHIRFIWT